MSELEQAAVDFVFAEEARIKAHERVRDYNTNAERRDKFNGRTYYRYQQAEERAWDKRQSAYKALKEFVENTKERPS